MLYNEVVLHRQTPNITIMQLPKICKEEYLSRLRCGTVHRNVCPIGESTRTRVDNKYHLKDEQSKRIAMDFEQEKKHATRMIDTMSEDCNN